MITVRMSTQGRVTLPASLRQRMDLAAGSIFTIVALPDGLKLTTVSDCLLAQRSLDAIAGLVKARSIGTMRSLLEFDAASLNQ